MFNLISHHYNNSEPSLPYQFYLNRYSSSIRDSLTLTSFTCDVLPTFESHLTKSIIKAIDKRNKIDIFIYLLNL